ncbi:hypothetical protein MACH09_34900 [Vibrio sp. MACH09]|nr:hypothetical protein MACH09_34900 [Vibrio sp. MACH09]
MGLLIAKAQPLIDMGVTVLQTGPNTRKTHELVKEGRVLLQVIPDDLNDVPDGFLTNVQIDRPKVKHPLKADLSLVPFFSHADVASKFGDIEHLVSFVGRCQAHDGDYCHQQLVTTKVGISAVRLCWHHDNKLKPEQLEKTANKNLVAIRVGIIGSQLGFDKNHALTYAELCWWAVRNDVYQHLPSSILDAQFGVEETRKRNGVNGHKETNARYSNADPLEELKRLSKPVLKLEVNDDPPLAYMRSPKPMTWHCEKYLAFVRTLPCVVTGEKTSEMVTVCAHHLIGHGEGKMAGKAHDLFVFPIRTDEHTKLHDNPKQWERRYGSQLLHVKNTISKALMLGAIE